MSLITYAAYEVKVFNNTTNTLNRIYLRATASTIGATAPDDVAFDSSLLSPDPCTGFGTRTLSCNTSFSIPPGGTPVSFIIVVRAPSTGEKIQIDWSAGGHEGNGAGNGCCAYTGTPATTTLIDPTVAGGTYTFNAQSFIKSSGGTLFTGDRWIPMGAVDPITTFVRIPAFNTASYDLGQILETEVLNNLNCTTRRNFNKCYSSDISIDDVTYPAGSGNYLTIVLRIAKENIKKGAKIENVLIQYDDGSSNLHTVGPCDTPTTPRTDGKPCFAGSPVFYKNKSVSGWTPELDGVFEFRLLNLNNGRFTLF